MSDIHVDSHRFMSTNEFSSEDISEPLCRTATPLDGGRGRSGGSETMGAGGASGVERPVEIETQCLDEMLTAAGACGASLLSAGALALVTGVACVGSTWTALECLQREAEARR